MARGERKAGPLSWQSNNELNTGGQKQRLACWPSNPEPGLIRLPGISNNISKTMIVQGQGKPLKDCVYHLHQLGKGKPWDCVFIPRPGREKGRDTTVPKGEISYKTTFVNCLPPIMYAKWTNRVWSKIRIWANWLSLILCLSSHISPGEAPVLATLPALATLAFALPLELSTNKLCSHASGLSDL